MAEPFIIKKLENLYRLADKIRKNKNVIKYYDIEKGKRRLNFVKKNLKDGNMVWCRLGNVVSIATPCIKLECKYKKSKEDILSGVSNYDSNKINCYFQITKPSVDWHNAEHINME